MENMAKVNKMDLSEKPVDPFLAVIDDVSYLNVIHFSFFITGPTRKTGIRT